MNRPRRLSRNLCRLVVGLPIVCASTAWAADPVIPTPATRPTTRPTAAHTDEPATPGLLGDAFESKSAGISFNPPADCKKIVRQASNEIVEYTNEEKKWSLVVTRTTLGQPMELETKPSKPASLGKPEEPPVPGLIDLTIDQMKAAIPGATVLRRDVINIGSNYCGLVVLRYSIGSRRWLQQQASLQLNNKMYYIFKFLTPGGTTPVPDGTEDNSPPDPVEKAAVETFNGMLDSIKLLDRSDIYADQVSRLYRTRTMFLNWSADKYRSIIDPTYKGKADEALERKQYFLVYQDHQVVGYRYELDMIETRDGKPGVVVYVRSHTEPKKGEMVDVGSNMFMTFDRRNEKWVQTTVMQSTDAKQPGAGESHGTEVGNMTWETKMSYAPLSGVEDAEEAKRDAAKGITRGGVPKMRPAEFHSMDVTLIGKSSTGKPIHKDLPPYYLPQAAAYLLPQLLLDSRPYEKRTYMFASYFNETGEIMMRYLDVEMPRRMMWKDKLVEAVAITDRLGLDGTANVHYMAVDGTYLYSENKETKTIVKPVTEDELRAKWKDVDFSKPQDIPIKPPAAAVDPAPSRGLPATIR